MKAIDKRKRIDYRTIHRVEETVFCASELNKTIHHMMRNGEIDPYSYEICQSVESLATCQVFLMAIFSIRFSEISQINPTDVKFMRTIKVLQPKTGKMRVIIHPEVPQNFQYTFNSMAVNFELISYDGVKAAINRAIPEDLKKKLSGSHSSTHIFRHLRASWLNARGISKDLIREYFDHESEETTSKYIHQGLFPFI